jgi:multicomponent Na+:H+ antiporter subunit G
MDGVLSVLSSALMLLGAVLGLIGAIGVVRLPDSYTRMHSASKAGALGAALILAGVAAASEGAFALAALFAMVVLLATAPLAAHAMARAAYRAGITPQTGPLGDALAEADENGAKAPLRS